MNKSLTQKYIVSFVAFLSTFFLLSVVQVKAGIQMIMAERFFKNAGWIEILFLSAYAGFIAYKMHDRKQTAHWRKISWLVFSFVFFSQLISGILIDQRFLMTGKLHLPVPAMIVSGALYRMDISFMPILFLSTILLTGPAWCSHLCYFGAFDNRAAEGKGLRNKPLKNKMKYKFIIFFALIFFTILLRILRLNIIYAALLGGIFGITGVAIILLFSKRKNKMVHCVMYCPVGTLTNFFKYLSPFRMKIESSCTTCMACTLKCKYDALNLKDIKNRKPGITCTYCGDCLTSCHEKAIRYKFFGLKAETARNLYLVVTISIHAAFIGLGRI